jgi:hypothetical protein
MLKPAVAGVLVGLIGLAVPESLATGYGWLQRGMRDGLPDVALWVILLLPFVKIATTSLSVGSGGSGGIFGPGMVIGGFVGLGVWRILHDLAPGMPDLPAPFMVVGMIACFGSVAHAPLGLMLMVAEMTGSLALLPPAMIAVGVAAVVVRDDSIYESQLRSRADAPGHRARFGLRLLTGVTGTAVLMEATVGADSPFAGVRVSSAPWPAGCVAVSIDRHSHLVAPTPDTELHAGDVVVVAPAGAETAIRTLFGDVSDP